MRESGSAVLNVTTPEQMQAVGLAIGRAIVPATVAFVVTLEGELGAGKTTLVGGILRAWGIPGPVRSPTYTLIEPYEGANRHLYHLDLYRLTDPEEVEALGIRDLLMGPSVLLIEWPSRARGALPTADLTIDIEYAAGAAAGRSLTFRWHSADARDVVRQLVAAIPELRLVSS